MLGVIVPYWNPFGNTDRLQNLDRCLARLRAAAGVRLLNVEMDCGNPSGLSDIVVAAGPESKYLWQKERLVNHGCEILAGEKIDYFGYVDADCVFTDADWPRRILAEFESGHNIVQGFARAAGGDNIVPAALASYPQMGARLHGGSMFLRRDLFTRIGGLYEYCIVGGGDFVLMMAITGDLAGLQTIFPGDAYRRHAMGWLTEFLGNEVHPACADNTVNILPHGNPQRSHRLRHGLLQDFVPEVDIIRGDSLGLSETGMRLLPRLRAYCAHREDRADIVQRDDLNR